MTSSHNGVLTNKIYEWESNHESICDFFLFKQANYFDFKIFVEGKSDREFGIKMLLLEDSLLQLCTKKPFKSM